VAAFREANTEKSEMKKPQKVINAGIHENSFIENVVANIIKLGIRINILMF